MNPRHHRRGYWLRPAHTCGLLWAYAKCPVMLPPAKKAVMRFILAGSLLAGLNGRSVDLIARNGDKIKKGRGEETPSSAAMKIDAGASSDVAMREPRSVAAAGDCGAIVGNGDATQLGQCAARSSRHRRMRRCSSGRKTASGCPGGRVCMRFREEETAPAIRRKPRGLMCSSAAQPDFHDIPMRAARREAICSIYLLHFLNVLLLLGAVVARHLVVQSWRQGSLCLIQRPYISKLCLQAHISPGDHHNKMLRRPFA